MLIEDHRHVSRLFGDFKRSTRDETHDRQARDIVHELSVHAAVEEQFLSPLVRAVAEDGSDLVRHAIDEHSDIKRALADLEKLDPSDAGFARQLARVEQAVTHHVEEEETELLPALRQKVDADRLESLGALMETAKSVVPTHPHPLVPGTAAAQLIAGPWASVVDRLRDLLAAAA